MNVISRVGGVLGALSLSLDCVTRRWRRGRERRRHCVDGGRLAAFARRMGKPADNETTSAVADDMLCKMVLADAALRDRNLLKADIPDAYVQGKRVGRPMLAWKS